MISVKEADRYINNVKLKVKPEIINFRQANGRVLLEDIRADRDLPPFNKSLMDGIAINYQSYKKGNTSFVLEGTQAAGYPALKLKSKTGCIEIMTGAVLPIGCDSVIPVEHIISKNNVLTLKAGVKVTAGQCLRLKGADRQKNNVLVKKGKILNSIDIGIAAAVGKAKLKVQSKIKVAIISSGDELIDVHKKIKPFQIHKSNSYFMEDLLNELNLCSTKIFHFKDDQKVIYKGLKQILLTYDVIVLTGGVSMGKFDFIPQVLSDLKVKNIFHKIRQRPGKPFWFGVSSKGKPVFALPGNPISTQVGLRRYVIPFLIKSLTTENEKRFSVAINKNIKISTLFECFLPVKIHTNLKGLLLAEPCSFSGSGDFASLTGSDGFIQIPEKTSKVKKGDVFQYFPWKATQ